MLGILISEREYQEYQELKKKNTPMKKRKNGWSRRCPICNYVVDDCVPTQNYCDRCGQKIK